MKQVAIYDRTMRVGTQGLGLQLSVPEKLAFVELLDDLGVDYIEAGEPGVNPRDMAFFEEVVDLQFLHAKLAAFGAVETHPVDSPALTSLLDSGANVFSMGASCWALELSELEGSGTEEHLDRVKSTLSAVNEAADELIFDAQHFFDGYLENPEFAISVLRTAIAAGATRVTLCDSNGGTLPHHLGKIVSQVTDDLDVPVGISAHNDADMAVANTLAAVVGGARLVKGAINGYGERCGSANLVSVVPALELKMGMSCLPAGHLRLLTQVARNADQLVNHIPQASQAYVGRNAFARKDHLAQRVQAERSTGEHVRPEELGNQRRMLMSNSASQSDVLAMLAEYGVFLSPTDPKALRVVEHVNALENQGYQFEGAEASLRLLVNEALGRRKTYFTLDDLTVTILIDGANFRAPVASGGARAHLRMKVGGELGDATSDGNGPINAMDAALRQVAQTHYPALRSVRLTDYKVRILSSGVGSESMCRVLIQSGDHEEVWGTVGVSTSIVQASWLALVDAFEYKLHKDGVEPIHSDSPDHRNM